VGIKIDEVHVKVENFWHEMQERIASYDLLGHPFYQAWAAGELSREDLRQYATDYYHHVAAFPTYLGQLYARLEDGELRRAVLRNLCDEEGVEGGTQSPPHCELWLDFAEGMGASRDQARRSQPVEEVRGLIAHFRRLASEASAAEALAAFYAYESQVPRVAKEKATGLRERYGADARATRYFTLHIGADVYHSRVWKEELSKLIASQPELAERALAAAENTARALWRALDGIERERQARCVAA